MGVERWEGKLVAGIVAEVPVLPVATLGIILKQNSSATLAVAG